MRGRKSSNRRAPPDMPVGTFSSRRLVGANPRSCEGRHRGVDWRRQAVGVGFDRIGLQVDTASASCEPGALVGREDHERPSRLREDLVPREDTLVLARCRTAMSRAASAASTAASRASAAGS